MQKNSTAKRTTEELNEHQFIELLQSNHYNEFVLTNNINNEVIKGKMLRCDEDNTGFLKNELILELDIVHAVYLTHYAHRIGCRLNKIPTNCTGVEQSADNEFKIYYNKVVFTLQCACNQQKSHSKINLTVPNTPLFPDLLNPECIDTINSKITENNIILVMDCNPLGNITGWLLDKWEEIYAELLNCKTTICDDFYRIYNASSTPYIWYDFNTDKCYLGIYSLQENKIISKFEAYNFKRKTSDLDLTEDFETKAKNLCTLFAKSQEQPA